MIKKINGKLEHFVQRPSHHKPLLKEYSQLHEILSNINKNQKWRDT